MRDTNFCGKGYQIGHIEVISFMSQEILEIKEKMAEMKPLLATLEWDLSRNQLNPGKKRYYDSLKAEYDELVKKLQNENNS